MGSMHILMVAPSAPAKDGLRFYSEHLIAGFKPEHNFRVFSWNYQDKITRLLSPLLSLPRLLKEAKSADIVHIQYVASLYLWHLLPLFFAAKIFKYKVLLTIHETNENATGHRFLEALQRLYEHLCDGIVVHTTYHKSLLKHSSQNKTIVIPHGVVTTSPFQENEQNGLILLPGFINPWKGHDVLIQAMATVHHQLPNAKLQIIGSGHDKAFCEKIKSLVKSLNATSYIEITDEFVSKEDFDKCFRKAQLVVLPYRRITMSGILTDAISAHKVTILSNLAPFIEVTKNQGAYFNTGEPTSLAKQIIKLLTDKQAFNEQKQLQTELVKEYSFARIAELTSNYYAKLNT